MDSHQPGASTSSPRFVGRDAQLRELIARLGGDLPGPSAVCVAGDPGIGKTRLLAELAARMTGAGWRVVWGRSWQDEGAPPYWLWTQVARDLRQRGRGIDLARVVLDEPDDPERFELFDATAALLRQAADKGPLLILLDDLHAADVPSLLLTRFVVEQLAGSEAGLVGTYRPRELQDRTDVRLQLEMLARECAEVSLDGLSVDAITHLVGDVALAAEIHEVTAGNPLFVEQVVRFDGSAGSAGGVTRTASSTDALARRHHGSHRGTRDEPPQGTGRRGGAQESHRSGRARRAPRDRRERNRRRSLRARGGWTRRPPEFERRTHPPHARRRSCARERRSRRVSSSSSPRGRPRRRRPDPVW